jgi:hypothetical protein
VGCISSFELQTFKYGGGVLTATERRSVIILIMIIVIGIIIIIMSLLYKSNISIGKPKERGKLD